MESSRAPGADEVRPRGRPRRSDLDERILVEAFRLLSEGGYARLSIEAVAAAAGIGRPTVYRRFRNKEELAMAALARMQEGIEDIPQTGDVRADLTAQVRSLLGALTRPYGMAIIGTILAEEHETPELLHRFRETIVVRRRVAFRAVLEGAQRRGELRPGVDLDLVVNLLAGAAYAQYIEGRSFAPDWPEKIVAAVLEPIMAAGS